MKKFTLAIIIVGILAIGVYIYGSNQALAFPTFLSLLDTPNSYAGQEGKSVVVNADANGLTFSDVNGGSGTDTNCSNNPNCIITGRLNSSFDLNASDMNASTLRLQQVGGLQFNYGVLNKALEIPFPTTCTEVFGVLGLPNSGMEFCASPYVGIALRVVGAYNFFFFEAVPNTGQMFMRPNAGPLSPPPAGLNGGVIGFQTNLDTNALMCYHGPNVGWKECGTYQSIQSNNYLEQSGDNNGVSAYTPSGEIRFYGSDQNVIIDYNIATDQNRLIFDLNDRNSSFLVSQKNTANLEFNSFMLDGNGNPYFFRVPTVSATLPGLVWDQNTGRIVIRASDSDLKEDVQDNPYDTSWCYELEPKIWTDKETGYPGVGYMAQDVENLLKSYGIPTWMTPTDSYGNKLILYDAIREFCWKAAIEDHKKLQETQTKLDLVIQLVCPIGKIDPICNLLNAQTNPV